MTCTICGKATGPGAMLCRPCKAALKRARQFTVQEIPGLAAASAGPDPFFAPEATPRSRRREREQRRRLALAAVAVLLLAAAAYVGGRGIAADRATQALAPPATPLPAAVPPEPAPPPALVVAPLPAPAPVVRATATPKRATPPPARTEPRTDPAEAASGEHPDTLAQLQASAPMPSELRAAPPPDRWQAMGEALARCADEGGLSGFICDQKVRFATCDGYWGRVAQCPAPSLPANPR